MSTEKNLYLDLWLILLLVQRSVSDILDDIPLSLDEFAMYGIISDLSPITAADMARVTGLPPTTVSSIVRRCEARGELVRVDNPADARSAYLELTPKAYELLGSAVPRLLEAIERLDHHLGGRQRQVRETLALLDSGFRADLGIAPRPYSLESPESDAATLHYRGQPLTPAQESEARQFIDWLRSRDRS